MGDLLPRLCVVVPCYNEEEVIKQTFLRLQKKLKDMIGRSIAADSKLIFVDDGSKDKTWELLLSFSTQGIKKSHSINKGQIVNTESTKNAFVPPPN